MSVILTPHSYFEVENMALGDNLKRLRRDKEWTQGDLSKASGVKVGHVSKLERNESDPKVSTIYKLINALGCSPNALLQDVKETNVDGLLAIALERASGLPEKDKEIVVDIIDKYCIALSLQSFLKEGSKTSINLMRGKTEPMV